MEAVASVHLMAVVEDLVHPMVAASEDLGETAPQDSEALHQQPMMAGEVQEEVDQVVLEEDLLVVSCQSGLIKLGRYCSTKKI